jgi:hypothetical protein
MKRAPSEDLFRLIRSLSKGEKRNFKLLAGLLAGEKDKKYIELFDVIDKQEVYDEGKILKVLKDLYGGQLAVGKHYLFKLILKSLVYFRNNSTADVNNIIEQVKVLAEKDLYPQAAKLLRKGLQEASATEDFANYHTLLSLQLEMLVRTQNEKRLTERLEEIETEIAKVMHQMANLAAYRSLSVRAFVLLQTRQVVSGKIDHAALQALKNDALVTDISQAHSARARIEYFALHRKFSSLHGNLEQAIHYSDRLLALYDELPMLKEESIRNYYAELANVCTYLLRLGRVQEAFAKMKEFGRFRETYPKARVDFFQFYYVMVLASALQIGEPERAIDLEDEIEREWTTVEGKVPKAHEMWLRYLLGYSHFTMGKPKAALRWVRKLLAEPRCEVRIDIQSSTRLLNLMIHCELGNYLLVESEVVSTKRFLERHDQFHDYEKQSLRCIKALALAANGPQALTIAQSWLQRLTRLEVATSGKTTNMLDVKDWLQARIEGRSMAELRKEKAHSGDLAAFIAANKIA